MKKIYLLTLGVVASAASFAQTGMQIKSDADSKQYKVEAMSTTDNVVNSNRGTETCTDVNRWAYGRSFDGTGFPFYGTVLHNEPFVANSYGTYVPVPNNQGIRVTGFTFYAGALRPDGNAVSVNAVIYAAGSDSLPSGAPLASMPVSLDTVINGSFAPTNVVFTTPVTITGGFILSIENSTTLGDSITILRGFTGSGVADNYPAIYQMDSIANGDYFRTPGIPEFGGRLPQYYPTMEFTQNNDFAMDVNTLSGPNEMVNFTYNAPLATNNPVLSVSGFLGEVTSTWDFNDGTGEFSAGDTTHTFVDPTKDYQVSLTDSLFMWDGGVCVLTQTHTLEKAWPASINDIDTKEVKAFVVDNNITVQNAEGLVTIYSITGAVVKKAYVSANSAVIDASDLIGGVYILTVNDKAIKFTL